MKQHGLDPTGEPAYFPGAYVSKALKAVDQVNEAERPDHWLTKSSTEELRHTFEIISLQFTFEAFSDFQ